MERQQARAIYGDDIQGPFHSQRSPLMFLGTNDYLPCPTVEIFTA
jgi:hypothetical protein